MTLLSSSGDGSGDAIDRLAAAAAATEVERAVAAIRAGVLVAFPTDTVYGIAAALDQPAALRHIFDAKGRERGKPLPVLLASVESMDAVAEQVGANLMGFLRRFWPGALTVVVPARAGLPAEVLGRDLAGRPTVGVRVPAHPVTKAIIERCGGALAVTSANPSGARPATSGAEVREAFGEAIPVVIGGREVGDGLPSTVIAVTGDGYHLLRVGAIPNETIENAWTHEFGSQGGEPD